MEIVDILIIINSVIILTLVYIVYKLYDTVNTGVNFIKNKISEVESSLQKYKNTVDSITSSIQTNLDNLQKVPLTIEKKIDVIIDKLNIVSQVPQLAIRDSSKLAGGIISDVSSYQNIASTPTVGTISQISVPDNQITGTVTQVAGSAVNKVSSFF